MTTGFIQRATLVAITFLLGADDGIILASRACAQSITAGTYNIRVAVSEDAINDWINTRRHLVFESLVTNQPDFMGFQEAYARRANGDGVTQQTALGELFDGTQWQYFTWEAENVFNMNPIIVNTDRFMPIDSGSLTVNFVDFLGSDQWDDFVELHEFFHGDGNGNVHFLGPNRYINWVVADDLVNGGRVAFITSHYETFIGENHRGAQFDQQFEYFSLLVNSSFGYASEQIIAHGELLKAAWGDLEVIAGGDFETPDPELPSQKAFEDANYAETWRFINGNGRRPTRGIDNMFVMPGGFTINDSFYDEAGYTIDASDHKPLYAEVTLLGIECPADLTGSIDPNDPGYGIPDNIVDSTDFFFYLQLFAASDPDADLTGSVDPNDPAFGVPDGVIDAADFFYFLMLFEQGCG